MSRRRLVAVVSVVCVAALGVTAAALARTGGSSGDRHHPGRCHHGAPAPSGGATGRGLMTPGGRATSTPLR